MSRQRRAIRDDDGAVTGVVMCPRCDEEYAARKRIRELTSASLWRFGRPLGIWM